MSIPGGLAWPRSRISQHRPSQCPSSPENIQKIFPAPSSQLPGWPASRDRQEDAAWSRSAASTCPWLRAAPPKPSPGFSPEMGKLQGTTQDHPTLEGFCQEASQEAREEGFGTLGSSCSTQPAGAGSPRTSPGKGGGNTQPLIFHPAAPKHGRAPGDKGKDNKHAAQRGTSGRSSGEISFPWNKLHVLGGTTHGRCSPRPAHAALRRLGGTGCPKPALEHPDKAVPYQHAQLLGKAASPQPYLSLPRQPRPFPGVHSWISASCSLARSTGIGNQ